MTNLDIQTVYANHLLTTFGNEGLAMFYKLPDFDIVEMGSAILVLAETDDETAMAVLTKALELFAEQRGVTVIFNGHTYTPALMSMVA